MLELKQIPSHFQKGNGVQYWAHELCGQKDLDVNLWLCHLPPTLTSLNFGSLIFVMGIKPPTSRGPVGQIDEIKYRQLLPAEPGTQYLINTWPRVIYCPCTPLFSRHGSSTQFLHLAPSELFSSYLNSSLKLILWLRFLLKESHFLRCGF